MADYLHTGAQSVGAMAAREERARDLVATWNAENGWRMAPRMRVVTGGGRFRFEPDDEDGDHDA